MQMRASTFLVSAGVFLLIALPAFADLVGSAQVLAGNTLQIGDVKIRLHGTRSPAPGQLCEDAKGRSYDCGARARDWLSDTISGKTIACHGDKIFRDGLLRAICYRGGLNLNGAVVNAGWAMAYGRTGYRYRRMQEAAAALKIGLHAGPAIKR